ncbi:hypothetical protein V6N12_024169 [Hibiscus sabdariffa]|uniref:Uncharacterized protein n=1 Tax=Hibiscus sabdariffa TaxID=183260 RepID=A0ABR2G090_9ROSI
MVKVDTSTKLQYGDWLRVASKKHQEDFSRLRGRIRYHDVRSSSNVHGNDLGKGADVAEPNLSTPTDADLRGKMSDDNLVVDPLDISSIETEHELCHLVGIVSKLVGHELLDISSVGSRAVTKYAAHVPTTATHLVVVGKVATTNSALKATVRKVDDISRLVSTLSNFDAWLAM